MDATPDPTCNIKEIARQYLEKIRQRNDPLLKPWNDAAIGNPLQVFTVNLEPSFWIIPVQLNQKVIGHIEIDNGRVTGFTLFYKNPESIQTCPKVVTRITAGEAKLEAKGILKKHINAVISEPVFVHDGPKNRLAWMFNVRYDDQIRYQVFATPGYAYQRQII